MLKNKIMFFKVRYGALLAHGVNIFSKDFVFHNKPVFKSAVRLALNILFPNTCYICKTSVHAAGSLCATCWRQLDFITSPFCRRCGKRALNYHIGQLCPCSKAGRQLHAMRASMYFNEMAQQVIHKFKYDDATEIQETLALWILAAANDLLAEIDCFAPIPLHRRRLHLRKYNQSAILARHLGKLTAKPVHYQLLERLRDTKPQVGLNRRERQRNIRNAFDVHYSCRGKIYGKRIALVDDVITTGATAKECAKMLLREGAQKVYILAIAQRQ